MTGLHPAGRRAIYALVEALQDETPNETEDLRDGYVPQPPKTWPSTLDYIETHCGGFYGVTTVSAEKGTGKTMLSLACLIEAAASGEWQVVDFRSEDDRDGYRDRFNIYLSNHPHAEACLERFTPIFVGKGQTPESLVGEVSMSVESSLDLPVLVGIDSINSIVNLSGRNYLQELSRFGLWMMFARRISCGDVSFMVTSESNKRGEAKGEALPFWSDVYVRMKKESENVVSMFCDKSRRTAGEGEMGKYLRVWTRGEFVRPDTVRPVRERPPLELVGGSEWYE